MNDLPLKDRAYVLRIRRDDADEDEFIPVATFTITNYKCGLRAGDTLKLLMSVKEYKEGDLFTVLTGAEEDPDCLWTLDPARKICEWDDDVSIYKLFAKHQNTSV